MTQTRGRWPCSIAPDDKAKGRQFAPAALDNFFYRSLTTTSKSCANASGDRMTDGDDDDAIELDRPAQAT